MIVVLVFVKLLIFEIKGVIWIGLLGKLCLMIFIIGIVIVVDIVVMLFIFLMCSVFVFVCLMVIVIVIMKFVLLSGLFVIGCMEMIVWLFKNCFNFLIFKKFFFMMGFIFFF